MPCCSQEMLVSSLSLVFQGGPIVTGFQELRAVGGKGRISSGKEVKVRCKFICAFSAKCYSFQQAVCVLCVLSCGVGTGQLHRPGTPVALPSRQDQTLGSAV